MDNEQVLIKAIDSGCLIDFYYEDKLIRKAAPHAIYISPTGKENLDAYQYDGYTKKGNLPDWRIFTLSKMENIIVSDQLFGEIQGYNSHSSKYNKYIHKI